MEKTTPVQRNVPVGAVVMVKCYRASSSHSHWCRRTNKEHVDLELPALVVYDPETDGKKLVYEREPWLQAKAPRGREQYMQQIMPHYPKLADIASVVEDFDSEGRVFGNESWITQTDGSSVHWDHLPKKLRERLTPPRTE